jgi:hypothetical protein
MKCVFVLLYETPYGYDCFDYLLMELEFCVCMCFRNLLYLPWPVLRGRREKRRRRLQIWAVIGWHGPSIVCAPKVCAGIIKLWSSVQLGTRKSSPFVQVVSSSKVYLYMNIYMACILTTQYFQLTNIAKTSTHIVLYIFLIKSNQNVVNIPWKYTDQKWYQCTNIITKDLYELFCYGVKKGFWFSFNKFRSYNMSCLFSYIWCSWYYEM